MSDPFARRAYPYTRYTLSISRPDDAPPLVVLAVLIAELGDSLVDPPPQYEDGWRNSHAEAFEYSATVAQICFKAYRLIVELDAPGTRLPYKASMAVVALKELLHGLIARWGCWFQFECDSPVWATTQPERSERRLFVAPPLIDVALDEYECLEWAFRQLRDALTPSDLPASNAPAPIEPPAAPVVATSTHNNAHKVATPTSDPAEPESVETTAPTPKKKRQPLADDPLAERLYAVVQSGLPLNAAAREVGIIDRPRYAERLCGRVKRRKNRERQKAGQGDGEKPVKPI